MTTFGIKFLLHDSENKLYPHITKIKLKSQNFQMFVNISKIIKIVWKL